MSKLIRPSRSFPAGPKVMVTCFMAFAVEYFITRVDRGLDLRCRRRGAVHVPLEELDQFRPPSLAPIGRRADRRAVEHHERLRQCATLGELIEVGKIMRAVVVSMVMASTARGRLLVDIQALINASP